MPLRHLLVFAEDILVVGLNATLLPYPTFVLVAEAEGCASCALIEPLMVPYCKHSKNEAHKPGHWTIGSMEEPQRHWSRVDKVRVSCLLVLQNQKHKA